MKIGYMDSETTGTAKYKILGGFDENGEMFETLGIALDDWENHRTLDYCMTKIKKALAKDRKLVVRRMSYVNLVKGAILGKLELLSSSRLKDIKEEEDE